MSLLEAVVEEGYAVDVRPRDESDPLARADLVAEVQAALPQLPGDCRLLWERVLAETASA